MSNTATRNRERKIVTRYGAKPIPARQFDWEAWYEGEEEGGPMGYGPTEEAALQDLKDETDFREDMAS
jgi:hypothetical protein